MPFPYLRQGGGGGCMKVVGKGSTRILAQAISLQPRWRLLPIRVTSIWITNQPIRSIDPSVGRDAERERGSGQADGRRGREKR